MSPYDTALEDMRRLIAKIMRDEYARGWSDAMKAIRKAALELSSGPRIQATVKEIEEAAHADTNA